MKGFTKQTVIMMTATTSIAFAMDLIIYNSAKGGKFGLPKKSEMLQILVVGVVMGFMIDFTLEKIKHAVQSDTENAIDELIEKEKENLKNHPETKGKTPISISYLGKTNTNTV